MVTDDQPARSGSDREGRLSGAVRPSREEALRDQRRGQAGHHRLPEAVQRLQWAWVQRPYTVVLSAVLLVPGALAIVYGDQVSAALSKIAADSISRLMGILLVVGPTLTLVGIARNRTLTETLGLTVTAIGCAIYGLGVILGLGLQGAVAGSGFLAIGAATILRVMTLAALAREADRASES
ncbi:MAG: hypothetical protein ACRDUV_16555 [Pseudonocardiaceae bacterium]